MDVALAPPALLRPFRQILDFCPWQSSQTTTVEYDESTIENGDLLNNFCFSHVSVKSSSTGRLFRSSTRSDGHKTCLHNIVRGFDRSLHCGVDFHDHI